MSAVAMGTVEDPPANPFVHLRLLSLVVWLLRLGSPLFVLLAFLRVRFPDRLSIHDVAALFLIGLCLLAVGWFLKVRRQLDLKVRWLVGSPSSLSSLPKGLLSLIPVSVFVFCSATLLRDAVCRASSEECRPVQTASVSTDPTLDVLTTVIVSPSIEELFFRGIVLHRFVARWNLTRGILASCILFAVAHGDHVLSAFLVGLFLTLIYVRTASLWVSGGCHAIYNAAVVLHQRATPFAGLSFPLGHDQRCLMSIGAIGALLGLIMSVRILWPRAQEPLPYLRNATTEVSR